MKTKEKNGSTTKTETRPRRSYKIPGIVAIISVFIFYFVYHTNRLKRAHDDYKEEELQENLKKYRIFTAQELAEYNGQEGSKGLYLAILGDVFDVERGLQHYGPQGTYHIFAGRDASRSFITGEFDGKKGQLDHVLSLSPSDLVSLKNWRDFYEKDYEYVGKVVGRFYDENGDRTEYFWAIERKIQFGLKQQEQEEFFKSDFPPCNVEWEPGTGTRVWCTKSSGGIDRDWAGYPIQYFQQESKTYVCVCAKRELFDLPNLRPYETCNDQNRECFVNEVD